MKSVVKKTVKQSLLTTFEVFPSLKKVVHKLNNIANQSEKAVTAAPAKKVEAVATPAPAKKVETPVGFIANGFEISSEEVDLFTKKALYAGYSVEYLNAKIMTKEERACELKRIFYKNVGYYLDLKNPKTFNQKIQWLKLNYYDKALERCVDKAEFKNYIDEQLGEGYTVPNYGSYEDENDIDFDALPDKFVLKSNVQSDARHIILVKDKKDVDIDKLKTIMSTWLLRRNNLCCSYCNAYWNVTPKIVVEEFLETKSGSIDDYKFYCYGGECKHFLVCKDRGEDTKYINYDMEFNCIKPSPNSYYEEGKYKDIDRIMEMIEIAEKLAEPFPFVRVDFYDVDGKLYVGELTFYPGGGYNSYDREWDEKFGELLVLPEANM